MDAITNIQPLGSLRPGQSGRVLALETADLGLDTELEERLLRMGLTEDAFVHVMHEGPMGRDPLAVKVDGVLVALRRREAAAVLIEIERPA